MDWVDSRRGIGPGVRWGNGDGVHFFAVSQQCPHAGEWEKLDTIKGYIKAIDSETLTIGERFWKKEIPLERVQKLTIPDTDREMDSVKGIDSPFGSRTSQTEIVLQSGEIDSSAVEVGDFVEVIYGKGERDSVSGEWEGVKKVKGYVKAIDAAYLIVGERFLEDQIALARVQKLIILDADRGIDKLRQPTDSLSVRMETRFRTGLMFEAGYFWGIRTEFLDFYSSGYKTNKGLPVSASLYINPIFSGERQGRLGLRGTYQTVQIFPKFPEQELLHRSPLVLEEDFRRRRDRHISGFKFRLVSILLVYQRVVHKSKRRVVLVDVAGGISYQSSSYNSGGEQLESPRNFPCGSVGIAFLMPVHSRVSLQASVRKGWLVGYFPDPFISGMSVTIGPILEF